MIRKINYITESTESVIKHSIENFLTENLYFTTVEKFIKQMKIYIPNFEEFLPNIHGNRIKVNLAVTKEIGFEKFKKLVKTFNYRIASVSDLFIELVPEKDEQTRLSNYFLHLSPKYNLDKKGLRCKSSGRFEQYEPRIFLYPLKTNKTINASDFDTLFKHIYKKCEDIVKNFNDVYHENENYNVYLIDLPTNFPIYKDPSNEDEAYYIENNIQDKYVNYIGRVESSQFNENYKSGFTFYI